MKRTFGVDPLECARCHAKMRHVALITKQHIVDRILSHLRLPLRPEQLGEHVVGYGVTDEPMPGWMLGLNPGPEEPVAAERGPLADCEGIDPLAAQRWCPKGGAWCRLGLRLG
jgi:hypothetical protein